MDNVFLYRMLLKGNDRAPRQKGPCCAGPIRNKKRHLVAREEETHASRPYLGPADVSVHQHSIQLILVLVQVASALRIWPFSIQYMGGGVKGKSKKRGFQAVHGVIHPSPLRVSN